MDKEIRTILNKLVMDWTHRSEEEGQAVRHIDQATAKILELVRPLGRGDKLEKITKVLDEIIADCEQDVKDFDGREFNGKTLGELHGIIEAKIQALAKIIKSLGTDKPY